MRKRNIVVSTVDRDRLVRLIDSARLDWSIAPESLDALGGELGRATVVEPDALPSDVVAMNSKVWFRDLDSNEVEHYTLVLPYDADIAECRISVLAPIGTALLGYRRGDIVEWKVPSGSRRLEITQVIREESAPQAEAVELPA